MQASATYTVKLINLPFYAYHGLHEEEAVVGGEFEVSVWARVDAEPSAATNLVNYVDLYQVVKKAMEQQEELLETLAKKIARGCKETFITINEIKVEVVKKHPPITGFEGAVAVVYEEAFSA